MAEAVQLVAGHGAALSSVCDRAGRLAWPRRGAPSDRTLMTHTMMQRTETADDRACLRGPRRRRRRGLSPDRAGRGASWRAGRAPPRWPASSCCSAWARQDGSEVSDAEWRAFLDAEVSPRFPDGLMVLTGVRPVAQQRRRAGQGEVARRRDLVPSRRRQRGQDRGHPRRLQVALRPGKRDARGRRLVRVVLGVGGR